MKTIYLSGTMLVFCLAGAYGQGKDSLTGLPVIPAAETMVAGKSYGFQPSPLPGGTVCKSKMTGDFFAILNMNVKDNNVKVNTAVAWYAANLSGFKKTQGYVGNGPQNAGHRSQTGFYNSGGTIMVFITGATGREGEETKVYSIAYQRYEPGLSEKTIASLTQGKSVCP
jgi:hypothetical protein